MPERTPSTDWKSILLAAAGALMAFVMAGGYVVQMEQIKAQERRLFAFGEAASHTKSLQQVVDQALSAPGLLAGLLSSTDRLAGFDELALRVLQVHGSLSQLQLTRDGTVWRTVRPLNRSGLSMTPSPATPAGASPGIALVAFGSTTLSSGPEGLVTTQAMHAASAPGTSEFWGSVRAVASLRDLTEATRLDELHNEGFDYDLSFRRRGEAVAVSLLRTGAWPASSSVVQSVMLPGGDSLELSLLPRGGWSSGPFYYAELSLAAITSVLLGFLLYLLLNHPQRLRREVEQTTAELRAANEELGKNNLLLDSIFERMPVMLMLRNGRDLLPVRANAVARELLAGEHDGLLTGAPENPASAPEKEIDKLCRRATESGHAVALPDLAIETGSGIRTLTVSALPLRDSDGQVASVLVVGEDITERKALTAAVEQHADFLEQIIDSVPVPLFLKDTGGRYLNVNRAFERFHGRAREDIVGKTVLDLLPPLPAKLHSDADRRLDGEGGSLSYESQLTADDGTRRDVVIHKALFRAADGRIAGIVGAVLDISDRAAAARRISHLNRTHQVLSGINETIVRIRNSDGLLERACEILVERGRFPLAAAYRFDDAGLKLVTVKGTPAPLAARAVPLLESCRECAGVLTICSADSPCANPKLIEVSREYGFAALALLPLEQERRDAGWVAIFSDTDDVFTDDETQLLADLAGDLSHALDAIAGDQQRRAAEENLKLAAQVFENSSEGIIITDASNAILAVNKTFSEVTGYTPDEVIGQNPRLLSSGKQDAGFYRELWSAIQRRGEWHGEVQNRRKNGEVYSEWLTISAVKNDAGKITNYVAVFSDITSSKQIEERLNFLANYDPLTELPNRVLFTDRLEQAIAKARVDKRHVAVMFLDLDRFNLINETFGHTAGDVVLREIADRLQKNINKKDSVSRMGGDEFAIILSDLAEADDAAPIAGNIMHALGQKLMFEGHEIYTSASIGISVFPDDGDDIDTLVKNADSAMYRAMEEGHNTFRFYHQEMNARSSERMSLETELRHALDRGELVMHYQPFIDARSGRIVGAEALIRWHRPGIGFITPAAFIPLLEETGLIVPIGEWVLKTACEDNLHWRQHGFPDLFVAVNFSAVQLADDRLSHKVGDILDRIGFDPKHLEIELTESMVMRDAERGIRTLHAFKELGTMLSVDDFGTGYSSLSYLKRLPIDTLKIDRSFIIDTPVENEAKAIVQAIIALGHSLDLKIIAEGTQTIGQVDFLRQVRCDLLQGFFFSAAVAQGDFIELLRQPPNAWQQVDWSADAARLLRSVRY